MDANAPELLTWLCCLLALLFAHERVRSRMGNDGRRTQPEEHGTPLVAPRRS